MPILFFPLRDVPNDEANDVRELLIANDIEFYETSAGNWGISMPAIWLYRDEDLEKIRPLFDEYQRQRTINQRALYLQLKQQGKNKGFLHHVLSKPVQILFYSGVIFFTFYVSFKWLFELGL